MTRRILFLLILTASFIASLQAFAGTGQIVIVSSDAPNVGFNDPTPRAPVGGNPGTTLGQQRMNVFLAAAEGWRKYIDTNVDIIASASFTNIPGCTSLSGVLGQAAPVTWKENFTNAPKANVFYPIALANKLANTDLAPGQNDIFVQFNTAVDNASCLGATNWYYGFDGKEGDDVDLYTVVSHELGHGLGLSGAAAAPEFLNGHPTVFDTHIFDRIAGLRWDQMTLEQRRASMTNTGNLVWDGDGVRQAATRYLGPATRFAVNSPQEIARTYQIGPATFGANPSTLSISGSVVQAVDAAAPSGDGCTAFTNATSIAGNIVLADRGNCTFVTKAQNAQAAGAIALLIVDNDRTKCAPLIPGGSEGSISIPVVGILASDGDLLKTQLAGNSVVNISLGIDATARAGVSPEGYVRLYAPCISEPGSSIYHWDDSATPNLLMEPAINDDLTHGPDLTLQQLLDLGWTSRQGRQFLTR